LKRLLGCGEGDAVVVVWGPEGDTLTAAEEIRLRYVAALDGVPNETRQPFSDGSTDFERILPGPDRMYPDTDTPPLPIADETLASIREALPETPWNRSRRYGLLGLGSGPADRLAAGPWAPLFDAVDPPSGATARRLAAALEKRIPFHRRRGMDVMPQPGRLAPLVEEIGAGRIRLEAMEAGMDALLESDGPVADALAGFRRDDADDGELTRVVSEMAGDAAALMGKSRETAVRWAMGRVMPRFLGKLDPAEVRGRVLEALAPVLAGARS
jgi:Glu-tRNA(Gln) amidotransferase subunit E-like FAD-binding protein